jgi:hypothetical protein
MYIMSSVLFIFWFVPNKSGQEQNNYSNARIQIRHHEVDSALVVRHHEVDDASKRSSCPGWHKNRNI